MVSLSVLFLVLCLGHLEVQGLTGLGLLTGYELPTLPSSQPCHCSLLNSSRSSVTGPSPQIRVSHSAFGCTLGSLCKKTYQHFRYNTASGSGEASPRACSCKSAISAPEYRIQMSPHYVRNRTAFHLWSVITESVSSWVIRRKHSCDAGYFWSHCITGRRVLCVCWHYFTTIFLALCFSVLLSWTWML